MGFRVWGFALAVRLARVSWQMPTSIFACEACSNLITLIIYKLVSMKFTTHNDLYK